MILKQVLATRGLAARVAVVFSVALLILTGCSAASEPSLEDSDEVPSVAVAAQADLVEVLERTTGGSYRFEIANRFGGDVDGPTISGVFDGTWSFAQTTTPDDESAGIVAGEVLWQAIDNGSTAYLTIPDGSIAGQSLPFPAGNPMGLAVGRWIQIDYAELIEANGEADMQMFSPSAFEVEEGLREALAQATRIVEGEHITVAGEDLRSFEIMLPDLENGFSSDDQSMVVVIDAQGFLRRVELSSSFTDQIITFTDIGAVPPIALPTEALDVTDLVLNGVTQPVPTVQPVTSGELSLALLDEQPELSTFRALLAETEVDEFVSRADAEWTFFAPTNDALRLVAAQLDELRQEPGALKRFVTRHVSFASVPMPALTSSSNLISERVVSTLNADSEIIMTSTNSAVTLNDAVNILVQKTDEFGNALFVIDQVLG